ncbi:MAG: formate dehydrogenase accessory sulfurtransferase FdhD [Bacillota bacterium]
MASVPVEKLLRIRTVDGPTVEERDDPVAVEHPLTVFLDGQELATLLCTPEHLEELVLGFLFGQGLIAGPSDVAGLSVEAKTGRAEVRLARPMALADRLYARRVITTGCGTGGREFYSALDALQVKPLPGPGGGQRCGGHAPTATPPAPLPASAIFAAARRLQTDSPLFRATGGVHTAVLADRGGETVVARDDIGRHNAVDKVLGHLLGSGAGGAAPAFLMVTGRVSSDIALKAVRGGIPVVASRSAPTSLAVELAERLNLTVAGFVRGRRLNLYSTPWRVDAGT